MEISTNRTFMGPVIPLVGRYPKGMIKRHLYFHVHCTRGHNSQDGESTQIYEQTDVSSNYGV